MIKINLLPKSINEKRVVRNLAVIFGVLLVAIIVASMAYKVMVIEPSITSLQAKLDEALKIQAEVNQIRANIQAENDQVAVIKGKLDFIKSVLEYNKQFPALYQKVATWTYERIVYSSLSCDGSTITIQARAKNLSDLGRYLLNLYRAKDMFTEVSISSVPGYPRGQSGSGAPVGGFGAPGGMMGGLPGGMPGGAPGMPPGMARPGGAPGMPPGMPGGMPAAGGMIAPGVSSLAGMGAVEGSLSRRSAEPDWIDFTVTLRLRTAIVQPTYQEGGAASATATGMAGGGFGGPPGMMGAAGGMPPGAMGGPGMPPGGMSGRPGGAMPGGAAGAPGMPPGRGMAPALPN